MMPFQGIHHNNPKRARYNCEEVSPLVNNSEMITPFITKREIMTEVKTRAEENKQ